MMVNQQRLPLAMIQFANQSYFLSYRQIASSSIGLFSLLNYLNILIPSTQRAVLWHFSSLISNSILSIVNVCRLFLLISSLTLVSVSPLPENYLSLSAIDDQWDLCLSLLLCVCVYVLLFLYNDIVCITTTCIWCGTTCQKISSKNVSAVVTAKKSYRKLLTIE